MRFTVERLARKVAGIDLTSATSAVVTGTPEWVAPGVLEIPFDRPLTPSEVEAVTLRLTSGSEAEAQMREACAEYLALTSPTAAQTSAQVRVLTRLLGRLIAREE